MIISRPPTKGPVSWIADFTYIWMADGWLYVAAVVDLFSRRVVGWSMSATMTAQLVTDALVRDSSFDVDVAPFEPSRTVRCACGPPGCPGGPH
jgi:transposase InsO family protein